MNYHSRVDEYIGNDGYNQNPSGLAAESTTRNSLNGLVNLRLHKDERLAGAQTAHDPGDQQSENEKPRGSRVGSDINTPGLEPHSNTGTMAAGSPATPPDGSPSEPNPPYSTLRSMWRVLTKYARFIGPGVMISVAYTDPGNYSTDVAAGAAYRFSLLFIVLLSNLIAIFLQSLCIKLGTVTGLNLAEHCRAFLPRWLNYVLYGFAEAAIIATDIAEVIGTAVALNILLKIPLVAGCAITVVDVLIILFFYSTDGSMRRIRFFELFVMTLVIGVVICFCIELSHLEGVGVGEVFAGYLPSATVVQGKGLYLSCGIVGATVMPHSLYLGSGIVQARLYAYSPESYKADSAAAAVLASSDSGHSSLSIKLRRPTPPIKTIKSSLRYSITELAISLSTLALFTNSAILILAGASLSNHPEADGADIFTIHDLLSSTVAPIAGTVFALALLLSGLSAGIVCTLAGQMISEGALHWTLRPWLRRLVTRSISITPAIIIAGAVGRPGLSAALNASQVVLSVILPVVSAPVIWFTCRAQYMMVYPEATALQPLSSSSIDLPGRAVERPSADAGSRSASVLAPRPALTRAKTSSRFLIRRITRPNRASEPAAAVMAAAAASATPSPVGGQVGVNMRNGWLTTTVAVLVWLLLAVMNVALLVLLGLGRA